VLRVKKRSTLTPGLDARQRTTGTGVDPAVKGEVRIRIRAVEANLVRCLESTGVTV
jgi:hypothetical protein